MTKYLPQPDDGKKCQGCTMCCRWPGDVLFSPNDLPIIANYLEMDERNCAETFFDITSDRKYLKSQPSDDGGCIFLAHDGCMIYPHRPVQCRTFPYNWQRSEADLMQKCALFRHINNR